MQSLPVSTVMNFPTEEHHITAHAWKRLTHDVRMLDWNSLVQIWMETLRLLQPYSKDWNFEFLPTMSKQFPA